MWLKLYHHRAGLACCRRAVECSAHAPDVGLAAAQLVGNLGVALAILAQLPNALGILVAVTANLWTATHAALTSGHCQTGHNALTNQSALKFGHCADYREHELTLRRA